MASGDGNPNAAAGEGESRPRRLRDALRQARIEAADRTGAAIDRGASAAATVRFVELRAWLAAWRRRAVCARAVRVAAKPVTKEIQNSRLRPISVMVWLPDEKPRTVSSQRHCSPSRAMRMR